MKYLILIGTFFIVFGFVLVDALMSPIFWCFSYFLGKFIVLKTTTHSDNLKLYNIFYFLFSFFGIILLIDNYLNFGIHFGFAGDDSRYFDSIILLSRFNLPDEFGLWEIVLSTYAFLISLINPFELKLPDILSFNWMLVSVLGLLISELTYQIIKKPIPIFLFVLSFAFCFKIVDSTVRLYRDVLVLIFMIYSFISIMNRRKIRFLLSSVFAGLIRGANGILSLVIFPILFLRCFINRNAIFYIYLFIGVAICIMIVLKMNFLVYASDISRTSRYESVYEDASLAETLEIRNENLKKTASSSKVISSAYSGDGISSYLIKAITSFFFPITFHSPFEMKTVNSYKSDKTHVYGFYIYNIITWIFICSWFVIIPYLFYGVKYAFFSKNYTNVFFVYYVLAFILIAFISGQGRHACAFLMLNPLFVTIGFYYVKHKKVHKVKLGQLIIMIGIMGWNYFRIFIM